MTEVLGAAASGGINGDFHTPLYHQLFVLLRQKILTGVFADGSQMPTELELAATYGVSRITTRRALDNLAEEGLVVRQRGRGTHVTFKFAQKPWEVGFDGVIANLQRMGAETKVELIDFGFELPPEQVRLALQCKPMEEVQRAIRVRRSNGKPFSYLTTFVPLEVGRRISRADMETTPLLTLLERSGITISGAEQTISATLADEETAPRLDMHVGEPLLLLTRTVYDQRDRPIEYIQARYRTDYYQFHTRLSRAESAILESGLSQARLSAVG